MQTKFIEAENTDSGGGNWGKFMVSRFSQEEWSRKSAVDDRAQLSGRGWRPEHVLVMDLQTGEGAIFLPGGSPTHDLSKHKIWVCPLFPMFLSWLYKQDLSNIDSLPALVHIDNPETSLYRERCEGAGLLTAGRRYRMRGSQWPILRPVAGRHPATHEPVQAVFYEWQDGRVDGFGDWGKLEAELSKGDLEELPASP